MYGLIGSGLLEERPITLFDSHPEQQPGIIYDSLSRLGSHLKTAWTGDVLLDVDPSMLRLQWYTTDGTYGKRDYELREYAEAQTGWEELCNHPEVARAMILGYPSQNPYSIDGQNRWRLDEEKKRDILASEQYRDLVPRAKKEPGIGDRIDNIIMDEDCREKRRLRREAETKSKEEV